MNKWCTGAKIQPGSCQTEWISALSMTIRRISAPRDDKTAGNLWYTLSMKPFV